MTININDIKPGAFVTVEFTVVKVKHPDTVIAQFDDGARVGFKITDIKSHTPAPPPEFDWDTAVAGMALKYEDKVVWFIQTSWGENDWAVVFEAGTFRYDEVNIIKKSFLTRADPKHDVGPAKEGK